MLIRQYVTDALSGNNITILPAKCKKIKNPPFWGDSYSANVPTDIVMRRMPLLMDFSLFTLAFNISPV